jgi:Reverse transcriptase (RNA-dependent DNA polymerase)
LLPEGYTQEEELNYTDTFSPVVKPTTIRLILSLVVTRKWCIRQLDVNNIFLHGELQKTIYMPQPHNFQDAQALTHVCRLHKSLYGLKQSPRAWYQKLRDTLLELGFVTSVSDPSLFIFQHNNNIVYLLVYVDDLVITGNNNSILHHFVQLLDTYFTIKDLDVLHYFLDIEVNSHDK